MTISKDDANLALGEIQAAGGRVREIQAYAQAAPFLMIWGVLWMVCDVTLQFAPGFYWTWPIGVAVGTIASIAVGASMAKPKEGLSAYRGSWRYFASWLLVMAFIVSLFFVLPIRNGKEAHSIFGLVFGFLYVGFGFWTGWRLIALGVALVGLTLIGFYDIGRWYPLYMGLVSGSALLLGGLWLRRI